MSNRQSEGPIQVFSNDVREINDALASISNRLDHLKGLRGRALIYDRVRSDDPRERGDVLTSGSLSTISQVYFLAEPSAQYVCHKPGTSLIEMAPGLRRRYNFSGRSVSAARVIIHGWATETMSKEVQVRIGGNVLCSLTWAGTNEALLVGDTFPCTVTTDEDMSLFVAASSFTESIAFGIILVELGG